MEKYRIISNGKAKSLFELNATPVLGTYSSTILNHINRWAGGSKAENVGQVSELIKDFRKNNENGCLEDWKQYHHNLEGKYIQILKGKGEKRKRVPVKMAGIEQGIKDIRDKLEEVKNKIEHLSDKVIKQWLENLTFEKTYCGLEAQNMILAHIANKLGKGYEATLGSMEDEQKGIDGFIIAPDNKKYALQIKSISYKRTNTKEKFPCPIVYYELTKKGIKYKFTKTMLKHEYVE